MHSMLDMGSLIARVVFMVSLALPVRAGEVSAKPDPAATRQVYDAVHSHLDTGGNLMLIVNTEGMIEKLIDDLTELLTLVPDEQIDADTVVATISRVREFLDTNGLLAVQGMGLSMAPREDGYSNLKMMVARDAAAARKSFWRAMVGTAPSGMKVHAYLPRDTVAVISGTGEINALWELIRDGVRDIGGKEVSAGFENALETFGAMADITAEDLIASIGAESVLSFQLSSTAEVPVSADIPVTMPAPSMLLAFSVRDGRLVETVRNVLTTQLGMELPATIVGDATVYSLPIPVPLPVPVQITLASHQNHVLIGSTTEVVMQALDAAVNDNGLTTGDEFRQAFPDLGLNNGIRFVSRRLGENLARIYRQGLEQEMGTAPEEMKAISELMERHIETFTALAIYNRRAGVQTAGITSMSGRELVGSALAAPAGMLAAVAIPSFMKSRQVAIQNSCINNLRMLEAGKEQAAMETGAPSGGEIPEHKVYEYIRGGKPTCPNGGAYTLNPVGVNATCSHPGHQLNR